MSAERWQEIERIFFKARGAPRAGWPELLARACGDDLGLRSEVLALLTADDASGEFLAGAAIDRLAHTFEPDAPALEPGMRIGAYVVLELLGTGGSGEVWRARDERLNRDVAIKTLLPHLAADKERLRGFTEEARTAGTLNDPNILIVHDVGEHDGVPILISECLDGQTLRSRLAAGRLGVREVLGIALGIARGLAAAHAHRIVHRDLKPENVFLKNDGAIKLLDFGIAKLERPLEGLQRRGELTVAGTVTGTIAYMAPEQIEGGPADARTDLFAVGVLMHEMLTGAHPFRHRNSVATLHAILADDPPDVASADARIPPGLARIVTRLLRKEPAARFQAAADLAWSLEQFYNRAEDNAAGMRGKPALSLGNAWWGTALAIAGVLAGTVWWLERTEAPATDLARFTWTLPDDVGLDSVPVVAPQGRSIAFVGRSGAGSQLFVRELASLEPRAVAGTAGARYPFWSPDGASLGFFANGRLMRMSWPSGAPAPVADAPEARGGAWSASGTIVFAPDVVLAGLHKVRAEGGLVEPATILDASKGDTSHWWPVALPDGVHFLYFVGSMDNERRGIYLGRLDRPAAPADAPLLRSDSGAIYAPLPGTRDGALLYYANGHVEVRKFDAARLAVSDDARAVGLPAAPSTLWQPMMLSASSGLLAFVTETMSNGVHLEAVTRDGTRVRVWQEAEAQNWPRVSPDGRYLARQRVDWRNSPELWIEDLERGTRHPVTTAVEPDIFPVWSPDSRYLAYVSGNLPGRPGRRQLRVTSADGTGIAREFPCPGDHCEPTDWSRDGSSLLVSVLDGGRWDVWRIALDDGGAAPLLAEPFNEREARFSPDGKWVAYVSEESGGPEVFVRSLGAEPRRVAVSAGGGAQPVWRRDGAELMFVDQRGQLVSVAVTAVADDMISLAAPTPLAVPLIGFGHWGTQYDVSPDGSRFYFLRRNDAPLPRTIEIVIGWPALVE